MRQALRDKRLCWPDREQNRTKGLPQSVASYQLQALKVIVYTGFEMTYLTVMITTLKNTYGVMRKGTR